jgi:hypothetical protein
VLEPRKNQSALSIVRVRMPLGSVLPFLLPLVMAAGTGPTTTVTCRTVSTPSGTSSPEPCVFPFRFDNVSFFECTPHLHSFMIKWCSVEVDDAGDHVSGRGRWGNCDPQGCRGRRPGMKLDQPTECLIRHFGTFDGEVALITQFQILEFLKRAIIAVFQIGHMSKNL